MIPGHIRIKDKVYFEYYGLEKPNSFAYKCATDLTFKSKQFQKAVKEYEASKQLIEVSNKTYPVGEDIFIDIHKGLAVFVGSKITDNQPCKAKIIDKGATIIELINYETH